MFYMEMSCAAPTTNYNSILHYFRLCFEMLIQRMISGTTAVCALYRPTDRMLYVGWAGDSKALLVSQNRVLQIVDPHKPDSRVNYY